jgi:hypothetical protein
MTWLRRHLWLVLAVVVAAGVAWTYGWMTATPDLAQALEQGTVTAKIELVKPEGSSSDQWMQVADDDPYVDPYSGGRQWIADGGSIARITISRPNNTSGTIRVAVPSGTALYGPNRGGQRLMTVHKAVFQLADGTQSQTIDVPVLCIDEFNIAPAGGADLALSAPEPGDRVVTEETDPIRKLVACLDDANMKAPDEQIAVWSASDDLLQRSRQNAIEVVTDRLAGKMTDERRVQLEAKRDDLKRELPMLTEEDISAAIKAEMKAGRDDLRAVAAKRAEAQITAFVTNDREQMKSCGYDVASLPLFN